MLLPLSWLKQFIKIEKTVNEIAGKLTLSGSEVEKIIYHNQGLSKVIVGQIKEVKPHPNADKLRLAYVDTGKGKLLEIVCGAPNIQAGQKVPVALLGGSVPGMKIEPREIRGVKSQGMLCSQRELGIGDDHSGIFILPSDVKIGTDVVELLQLDQPVMELEITPNRADCFSIRGLAREVSSLYNLKLTAYSLKFKESNKKSSSVLSVEVQDKELCPKYTARVIENVKVQQSPLWLQNKLRQVGIKSINNIVDVTNYVMMELGQPLHAFDASTINNKIVVRRAKKGESILALDGNKYDLNDSMLVIADTKVPIAIAGIMGGEATGVKNDTQTVILESAIFNPVSIRKTSRELGLRSESSARFEKGLDPVATEEAINLAAKMIAELSGGTILKGIVSVEAGFKPALSIKISTNEINRLLGVEIKPQKIKSILQSLGFGVMGAGINLTIKIPSWRADVVQGADIVEEIGRMIDYNSLPKTLPAGAAQSPEREPSYRLRRKLRQFLIGNGYSEILTYSFYDEKLLDLSGYKTNEHIVVVNPVNSENKYLRTSLKPWMLAKLSQNSALLSREQFYLFEIGKVFLKPQVELWQAAIGLIDITATNEVIYRRLRGILESFIGQDVKIEKTATDWECRIDNKVLATIAIKEKNDLPGLRLRAGLGVMIINLEVLIESLSGERQIFKSLPFYPTVERDLAIIVPEAVQYNQIEEVIKNIDSLLKNVVLFDVYHGLKNGTSLAFRLTFGSTDRTLSTQEVDIIIEKLKKELVEKLKVSFR